MSRKTFADLSRRSQIARINAALARANDNIIEPMLMNDKENRQLPPGEQLIM